MKIQQIFTPNDTPTVTYVDRAEHKLEKRLREYYETPNMVVSVSGPSKSGKTVLIKKVVPQDCLIPIVGAAITSADNLWDRVLNWMGSPSTISSSSSNGYTITANADVGGKLKIPFVAEGSGKIMAGGSNTASSSNTETFARGGLFQVTKEIANSEFVVFIDDFHYIKEDVRDEIGKQIKAAAESGVKIITASVPHRSDDVVRSNPELRGRVAAVDLNYWTSDELIEIARRGFWR